MVGQMWQQQDMAVAPQELSPNAAVSRNTRDADKASGLQLLDPKQRKRIQNRIAQRTYRRNQRQRVQALEEVVAQATENTMIPSMPEDTHMITIDPIGEDSPWHLPRRDSVHSKEGFGSGSGSDDALQPTSLDTTWNEMPLGAHVTATFRPALHRSAGFGNESMCRLLLDRGADIGKHDGEGKTALHIAVETGNESLTRLMLENKNPSVKDSLGRTALFSAVQSKNEALTRLLLDFHIDVNCRDIIGDVALHIAVENGLESIAMMLLKHGADVDA